ncbi:MAG: M28 family peptidase, partial [Thermoleophilia bacterium]|nr:M28 family peptidase [Thermoleophilia bacterium]
MHRRLLLLLVVALATAVLLPTAAQAISYDKAVDKLVKSGYPKKITKKITGMGTSKTLGFRWAGSPSDNASARYIAAEMRRMGLRGVRLEKVPLDVWDYRSASVSVSAPGLNETFVASGFAGARGTGAMPVASDIVYVGTGTLAEFDAAGDVSGKIVLVDLDGYSYWICFPQMLAGLRGAVAVVSTHAPDDFPITAEFFTGENALGSFDAETDYDAPPLVYIARGDGAKLRAACQAGDVSATVKADIRIRLEEDGGYGYNVVGKIPGTVNPRQMVLVTAHHDAHFRGAEDDTSAVATALTMAKAMKMSRTRPAKTFQIMITTGEEFGTTNSWYDWLIGATHAITKAHPGWAGRVAAQINLEWQGAKNAPLQVRANAEMAPYVQGLLDDNAALLPYGVDNGGLVRRNVWTWNDQWPFTAAGVPSVYFVTKDETYRGAWYHSQYDTMALIDWSYIGKNAKLYRRVHKGLDKGIVPYDFTARADQFADWTADDPAALVAAGIDEDRVDWLYAQFDRFAAAGQAFKDLKAQIGSGQHGLVNARLMEAERIINSSLTALDQWEGTTYPHIQLLDDVAELNATIADLEAEPVDPDQAQADLYDVGPFWYGDSFGREVYERQLQR